MPTLATLCWHWAALPLPWLLDVMAWVQASDVREGVLSMDMVWSQALGCSLLAIGCIGRRRGLVLPGAVVLAVDLMFEAWQTGALLTVLDVGQGTAVVFSDGQRVLVYDTGGGVPGGYSQAEKVLHPFLQRRHNGPIDTLIISHGDLDHSAGAEFLHAKRSVRRHLGFGGEPCRVGMAWQWGVDTRFQILNGLGQSIRQANAESCVLLIEHRGYRMLLAGDVDLERERQMVRYWRETVGADWLLVAHHGSQTSTGYTWLKWVVPDTAVLSRARANRFGHPAGAVMIRLAATGADVRDTALDGTLRWRIDSRGEVQLRPMRRPWTPYWLRF